MQHHPPSISCRQALTPVAPRQERAAWYVTGLTVVTMFIELAAGYATGSMALTADGWHMATHAGALGLSALAYWFARSRAAHRAFSFGTGKVHALAGYTSAIFLAAAAVSMIAQSALRFVFPTEIAFLEALPVAVAGLVVNVVSIQLLDAPHGDGHEQGGADSDHHHGHHHHGHHHHGHHDHNHRAAYLHVLADAMTSLFAIAALLAGRYLGWAFLDPITGILGGLLILRWATGLCGAAARQLVDATSPPHVEDALRAELEQIDDVRVLDLHVWDLAPGRQSCIVSMTTSAPRDTAFYRERILARARLAHLTVEVHRSERTGERSTHDG